MMPGSPDVLVLQHAACETLGAIEDSILDAGLSFLISPGIYAWEFVRRVHPFFPFRRLADRL